MTIRDDLLQVLARRALTEDAARPDAVERLHAKGGRTAREHIASVVDPGSFVEYGRYVTAAQEARRTRDELLDRTVADGLVGGVATIDGHPCAVLSYDYLVMAGTQGARGHRKTDRLVDVITRLGLPTIFFASGGGGRPGDTDIPVVSALDVPTFATWARLSGRVPRIAVVDNNCFAGNAVIAGTSDLIVASERSSLGLGGPAMIAGGGLGEVAAADVGPLETMTAIGVVDVAVDSEDLGATARTLLGYFLGRSQDWVTPDQEQLRDLVPERERTSYDVGAIVEVLCDEGSVTVLRPRFAPELMTALGRVEGRTVGVIANDTRTMAGAVTADAGDKAARFLQLCDAYDFPVISLVDTPGMMVGVEAEETAIVRHASRLLIAGAQLQVPLIGVVLRRGYGLGAMAMLGGSTHEPVLTVCWPGAHLGAMGLEGAVRLSMRNELNAITDETEREKTLRELVAYAQEQCSALNVARHFEVDDVIDPAETRGLVAQVLASTGERGRTPDRHRSVDAW
jgi:acetyl-CoA carboxylase carboxyltransferase component